MRISDWSSDVCSSDLEGTGHADALALTAGELVRIALRIQARVEADQLEQLDRPLPRERLALAVQQRDRHHVVDDPLVREEPDRSEERRVGTECVRTGRSRGARYNLKKTTTTDT